MKTLENVPFKLQTALGGRGGENWMMIEGREKIQFTGFWGRVLFFRAE